MVGMVTGRHPPTLRERRGRRLERSGCLPWERLEKAGGGAVEIDREVDGLIEIRREKSKERVQTRDI